MKIFKDTEIVSFYWIICSPGLIPVILTALQQEWGFFALTLFISACFLYFGWPLIAVLTDKGEILFKGPVRRVTMTNNLMSIKATGVHDYRSHLVIRTKGRLPIGFRCSKFSNAPVLAQAFLDLIDKSPQAKVTDDAFKLLRKVAEGNTKPLS